MITIWKLENDSWKLIFDFSGTIKELSDDLEYLRQDGFEYRAELKTETTSQILEV